jgi:hypothetical protein
MEPFKIDGLKMKFRRKFMSATGTKIVEYGANLLDGREFFVQILCYASAPGNTMGSLYYITWPENENQLMGFGQARLAQNGDNCDWGVWGSIQK